MSFDWIYLLKIVIAMVLGGAIGFEREKAHRPAGLRTNILVCIGSTLVMLIEEYYHHMHPEASDHLRMAAQVITGIGFIGAGTIIHTRSHIRGLTTAATIWVTAAIGMSVGIGFYLPALVATVLTLLSLRMLKKFEKAFVFGGQRAVVVITGESKGNLSQKIMNILDELGIQITDITIAISKGSDFKISILIPAHTNVDGLVKKVMKIEGVKKVTTELEVSY